MKIGAIDILGLVIGVNAGILGGLIGIGGGMVMIPLMVAFLGMGQHQAHGTSLFAVVFTGLVGALTYAMHGSVNHFAAAVLAITGGVMAAVGARYTQRLSERMLRRVFGFFLIAMSVLMLLKPYLPVVASLPVTGGAGVTVLLISGTVVGFLAGLMGVGGGGIMIPVLVLIMGMNQYTAQGTSLAAMVPPAVIGSWTHRRLGNVRKDVLLFLIAGVLVGTWLGGAMAHLVPERELRILFSLVILWVGFRDVRASYSR